MSITAAKWKTPTDERPFQLDYTRELSPASDTVSTSTWASTPTGLTLDTASILSGNLITQTWARSGQDGVTYLIENTITSVGGRTLRRSFTLTVATERPPGF